MANHRAAPARLKDVAPNTAVIRQAIPRAVGLAESPKGTLVPLILNCPAYEVTGKFNMFEYVPERGAPSLNRLLDTVRDRFPPENFAIFYRDTRSARSSRVVYVQHENGALVMDTMGTGADKSVETMPATYVLKEDGKSHLRWDREWNVEEAGHLVRLFTIAFTPLLKFLEGLRDRPTIIRDTYTVREGRARAVTNWVEPPAPHESLVRILDLSAPIVIREKPPEPILKGMGTPKAPHFRGWVTRHYKKSGKIVHVPPCSIKGGKPPAVTVVKGFA